MAQEERSALGDCYGSCVHSGLEHSRAGFDSCLGGLRMEHPVELERRGWGEGERPSGHRTS